MSVSVLLIDDDAHAIRHVRTALEAESHHFAVTDADTIAGGIRHLERGGFDCVLLDYRLPDGNGLDGLRRMRQRWPRLPVVMLTAAGSERVAVEAMKLGASDYVAKHGLWVEWLSGVLQDALGRAAIARSNGKPTAATAPRLRDEDRDRFAAAGIIGRSPAFEQALALAARAAASSATVLLEGETGTGKELFARAIHQLGSRATHPFLAVNCAAVPEALLESELFGHVRGAFSGADRERRGLFEEAAGGTLFLDEAAEMPMAIQAKLLRLLQEGEVRPLGSSRARFVDTRIIAGANTDLHSGVLAGSFRRDLYHRLHVLPIQVPPLRDRPEDVRPLAEHCLRQVAALEGGPCPRVAAGVWSVFLRYSWPGNVRELRNEMHRLVLCAERPSWIEPAMLHPRIRLPASRGTEARALRDIVREVEIATIVERLRLFGNQRTATARSLGLTREGLWQKLRQLGITPPSPERQRHVSGRACST